MIVTFFGHRDAPQSIQNPLKETVRKLIETENADLFYIGNQGSFDYMVRSVLRELKQEYPHISYYVVLAYRPEHAKASFEDYSDTILPEPVALSMPRFAILKRNDWMLAKSDTVVSYVTCSFGGAAKMKQKAIQKGKHVIEISE